MREGCFDFGVEVLGDCWTCCDGGSATAAAAAPCSTRREQENRLATYVAQLMTHRTIDCSDIEVKLPHPSVNISTFLVFDRYLP